MPVSVIPVTGALEQPVGAISQTDFPLISPRLVETTDTLNINFGDPFVLNPDNTYSSVASYNGRTVDLPLPHVLRIPEDLPNSRLFRHSVFKPRRVPPPPRI